MARYKLINQGAYSCYKKGIIYDERWKHPEATFNVSELVRRHPSQWELIKEDNMEELKISKEKVLEAANKCSTSKEVLKVLFPEVFTIEVFTKLGLEHLINILENSDKTPNTYWHKIPGQSNKEKAKSISDLIYNTWCR